MICTLCVHVLLLAGLEIGYALFPSWQQRLRPCVGHCPLHHAAPVVFGSWLPLLSWLLHHAWPHVTTRDAVAQRVSPFLTHAANSPACLPLPSLGALSLCCCFRLPVFCWFVCFVSWCGSLFGRAVPTEANTVNILGPQP